MKNRTDRQGAGGRGSPIESERSITTTQTREEEIYRAALRLFLEKGYHATSMRDIGQAVGMLKGSLYTYIESKEDLLVPIFERSTLPLVHEMQRIVAEPEIGPCEQLRRAIQAHVTTAASKLDVLTVFVSEWRALRRESLSGLRASNAEYQKLFTGIIERGVAEGVFRPVDCRITMLALVGMCNSMVWWYRPDGRLSAESIADEFADLILSGLAPRVTGDDGSDV